jgi:hypothetical protein
MPFVAMKNRQHKRTVERIRLLPHLDGVAGSTRLELTEISMGGARLQHYQPLHVGTRINLRFAWGEEKIAIPAVVVRCSVERFGANSVFLSGVRFDYPDAEAKAKVRRMIESFVKQALDSQTANAKGECPYDSRLMRDAALGTHGPQIEVNPAFYVLRDEGFVRYTWDGNRWTRTRTWEPQQPDEGFTIWHFEDGEQASLLCRDYERSTPDMRMVIRLCAELSLFVDDTIPPQKFSP